MKSKTPAQLRPYDWPQSGRPIQPYRLDPIVIASDLDEAWNQNLGRNPIDTTALPYITEPIYLEVLKLDSPGGWGFLLFAMRIGLHEFLEWVVSETDPGWDRAGSFTQLISILERYESGSRHFTEKELTAAWTLLPEGMVRLQTRDLWDAITFAKRSADDDDPALAVRGVLRRAWEKDVFNIEIGLDETTETPVIYERPGNIWARAWFELVEDLRAGRFPKSCSLCGGYYVPRRRNKKFCSDNCRNRAYDRKRANNPKRREDQAASYLKRKAAKGTPPQTQEPDGQGQ